MATTFGGSRLANLREKRTSGEESPFKKEELLKLSMPADESDEVSYQPSSGNNLNRTQTRLLKGRIERPAEREDTGIHNQNSCQPSVTPILRPKLSLNGGDKQAEQMRLVINDDKEKTVQEERRGSVEVNPMRTTQKRIMISKEADKERSVEKPFEQATAPLVQVADPEPEKPTIFNEDKPIKEEDIEESMPGETDLVECPEGCGRKFNRKALEKHSKACKLVFMSKRKEFNSEAKRLVNKEQATIAKQTKEKQKKESRMMGTKGFQKTGDNWKNASEDFRAVVKAIKKDLVDDQNAIEYGDKEEMKITTCKFCDKPFAQIFLEKHLQVCGKKRESEKKKTTKKK